MSNRLASLLTASALAGTAAMWATAALATQEPPKVVPRAVPPEAPAAPAAAASPAATRAATTVAPVIVEATKPAELKKQTWSFVQTFAGTTVILDQVARWAKPVCVTVQGLPFSADLQVKSRVEEVAEALKVPVQGAGCKPNLQVVFTDQPQAFMDKVAKEHEQLLGWGYQRDKGKLKTVTRPVQAWYVTGTGGAGADTQGMTFETVKTKGPGNYPINVGTVGRQPHGFQYDDESNYRGTTGCGDKAKFTACLTSEFQSVLVVADIDKAAEYSPGLIADYVVMLALAQPKSLDGCTVLPSVIDLFSRGCPNFGMDGLTRADVAYLTALYKTDLEARKGGQMTDMAGRMADMLLKANTADRLATFGGATVKASTGR